ncbi:hypothetical protein CVT24_004760 [Panaeolus cyanescens]|uniref:Exonuclease domain-containing protein n=1 Tax=Panaeolus cyanescens TaxID=181874 RepID=A0A409V9U0_9AGAR|nr:hypothetical protein CVT24_004760 [Panaeolus cyanescens]
MEGYESAYSLSYFDEHGTDSSPSSTGEIPPNANTVDTTSNYHSDVEQLEYDRSRFVSVGVITVWAEEDQGRKEAMAARVSICDYYGAVLFDTYVHPRKLVLDYRAQETGLNYNYLCGGLKYPEVQKQVSNIIENKVLIGHRIWIFLSVGVIRLSVVGKDIDQKFL